jgi:hypothetical protein
MFFGLLAKKYIELFSPTIENVLWHTKEVLKESVKREIVVT